MTARDAADLIREFFWIVLVTSAPAIVATACVGTFVAVLQALTQIQETTLMFVAKLFALAGVFLLAGTLCWDTFEAFSQSMFQRVATGAAS